MPNKFMSKSHQIWFPKRDPVAWLLCYDRGSKYTCAKLDGWNTKPDETKSAYVTSVWFLNLEPYKAGPY